eukprot:TRINITY_DN7728_c1_g1_i2.p1 TRINITY_DN7728_c1_g1~~TRINITY_DN7728_c1_g1_i2.p1  ORF type:complete len:170 (+),score=6.95 TRINITY_DN7728_c1_g1_i2:50-559(+)
MYHYTSSASDDSSGDRSSGAFHVMSRPCSGPSEDEVPRTALCQGLVEQPWTGDPQSKQRHKMKNPMPASGSRRDSCGTWSAGSHGHECGLCQGPCKDVRSGRGCTFGRKCRKCHFPHPEVSSSSLRGKKSSAATTRRSTESAQGGGFDQGWQLSSSGSVHYDARFLGNA